MADPKLPPAPPVILITYASSSHGRAIAEKLLHLSRFTIRLAHHGNPYKFPDLLDADAHIVKLNPTSLSSMAEALTDVTYVFLIMPSLVGTAERSMFHNFIKAAISIATPRPSSILRHVVYIAGMDSVDPSVAGFDRLQRVHRRQLQKLRKSGLSWTSLRPVWFHENPLEVKEDSVFPLETVVAKAVKVVTEHAGGMRSSGRVFNFCAEKKVEEEGQAGVGRKQEGLRRRTIGACARGEAMQT